MSWVLGAGPVADPGKIDWHQLVTTGGAEGLGIGIPKTVAMMAGAVVEIAVAAEFALHSALVTESL